MSTCSRSPARRPSASKPLPGLRPRSRRSRWSSAARTRRSSLPTAIGRLRSMRRSTASSSMPANAATAAAASWCRMPWPTSSPRRSSRAPGRCGLATRSTSAPRSAPSRRSGNCTPSSRMSKAPARRARRGRGGGGGGGWGGGLYMEPTVLTGVTRDMAIARQEVFGPVLSMLRFGTLDEAIDLANSTLYGLSAAVWSQDINTCITAARRIKAGTVWVNTFLEGHAELPFGGYRESGIGRELGRFAAEDYTETKTVHLHLGARTDWYLPPT